MRHFLVTGSIAAFKRQLNAVFFVSLRPSYWLEKTGMRLCSDCRARTSNVFIFVFLSHHVLCRQRFERRRGWACSRLTVLTLLSVHACSVWQTSLTSCIEMALYTYCRPTVHNSNEQCMIANPSNLVLRLQRSTERLIFANCGSYLDWYGQSNL